MSHSTSHSSNTPPEGLSACHKFEQQKVPVSNAHKLACKTQEGQVSFSHLQSPPWLTSSRASPMQVGAPRSGCSQRAQFPMHQWGTGGVIVTPVSPSCLPPTHSGPCNSPHNGPCKAATPCRQHDRTAHSINSLVCCGTSGSGGGCEGVGGHGLQPGRPCSGIGRCRVAGASTGKQAASSADIRNVIPWL